MVISNVAGRGAPESVRFWREPPPVREPDVAIFGIDCVIGFVWSPQYSVQYEGIVLCDL